MDILRKASLFVYLPERNRRVGKVACFVDLDENIIKGVDSMTIDKMYYDVHTELLARKSFKYDIFDIMNDRNGFEKTLSMFKDEEIRIGLEIEGGKRVLIASVKEIKQFLNPSEYKGNFKFKQLL